MSDWYEFDECTVITVTGAPQTIPAGVWPVGIKSDVQVVINDRTCTMPLSEWTKLLAAKTVRKRP